MMESSFYYLDDTHATTSSSSAKKKERNESSIHNNSVKRSPSFVVDLTDSPISKRQSLEESKVELKVELEGELNESSSEESKDEYKEEATTSATATTTVTTKNQPTIGNSSNTTFIPPIRIGGTSLLPTSVSNRLSVGSTVSTSDSPVTEAKESKITLSTSQKRAVDAIMARKSVFFSGAAGSGKSFLLKVVQDVLDSIDKGDRIVSFS